MSNPNKRLILASLFTSAALTLTFYITYTNNILFLSAQFCLLAYVLLIIMSFLRWTTHLVGVAITNFRRMHYCSHFLVTPLLFFGVLSLWGFTYHHVSLFTTIFLYFVIVTMFLAAFVAKQRRLPPNDFSSYWRIRANVGGKCDMCKCDSRCVNHVFTVAHESALHSSASNYEYHHFEWMRLGHAQGFLCERCAALCIIRQSSFCLVQKIVFIIYLFVSLALLEPYVVRTWLYGQEDWSLFESTLPLILKTTFFGPSEFNIIVLAWANISVIVIIAAILLSINNERQLRILAVPSFVMMFADPKEYLTQRNLALIERSVEEAWKACVRRGREDGWEEAIRVFTRREWEHLERRSHERQASGL